MLQNNYATENDFLFQFTPKRHGEGTWFLPNTKVNQINTKAIGKYFFVERTSSLIQKGKMRISAILYYFNLLWALLLFLKVSVLIYFRWGSIS